MIRKALFAAALLAAPPALAANDGDVRSQAIMDFGDAGYAVTVRYNGQITIECVRDCSRPARLVDDPAGTSIGIFRLTDNDNLLFTTWVGGSGYKLVVYAIDPSGPRKVFDEYTVAAPDILGSGIGGPSVRLTQYVSQTTRKKTLRSWRWNAVGGIFTRAR
jgi:hypothetical protein